MGKYTPGNWHQDCDGSSLPIIYADNHRIIAHVKDAYDETEANANLIAAAPDLLEACESPIFYNGKPLAEELEDLAKWSAFRYPEKAKALKAKAEQIKTAIAKARGEK
jgi:hypothetical protein